MEAIDKFRDEWATIFYRAMNDTIKTAVGMEVKEFPLEMKEEIKRCLISIEALQYQSIYTDILNNMPMEAYTQPRVQ